MLKLKTNASNWILCAEDGLLDIDSWYRKPFRFQGGKRQIDNVHKYDNMLVVTSFLTWLKLTTGFF